MHSRNTRLGLILFGVYLIFYCGFVFLNALAPDSMERTSLGGLNLAILYGFALIALAFLLAMVYGLVAAPDDKVGHGNKPEDAS